VLAVAGVAHRFFGTAVGKGRQSVKTEIERLKFDQLTCRQAVAECAKV
jgi:20S proteasome subunit alpha 7